MKTLREHSFFTVFFGGLFLYFLWPLILLKKSFVLGDYGIQFFPWSYFYSQSLKSGTLPYWTFAVGNGFPLVAEGQVAAYYPIHLLLYRFLPFLAAYSSAIWLHFLLGGIGAYVYAQKIGLKKEPATLTALLFSFSSAYGGCFYTTGTLRVLSWLPWAMWAIVSLQESADGRGVRKWTLVLALLMGQMWLAGFPQMALYAAAYLGFTVLFGGERKALPAFILAGVLAIVLALPQVMATVELAKVSVRSGESADFAMWGSVLPFAPVSLAYPEWGNFLRVSFYVGILPLLFFVFELFSKDKPKSVRVHLWLATVFLLLSFGKYNPAYAWAVKAFSFTALRNPSKFLFFTTVSMSVVAGFGMQRWLENREGPRERKVAASFFVLLLALPAAAGVFWKATRISWEQKIPSMAQAIYSEKTNPSKNPEDYANALKEMLQRVSHLFSFDNPHLLGALVFLASACLLFAWRGTARKRLSAAALLMTVLNLAYYSHFFGTGFLGNTAAPEPFKWSFMAESTKEFLRRPEEAVAERASDRDHENFEASRNLFYGLRHAGLYSPLMIKRHYELTRELGFVDASLGRAPFSDAVWMREKPLLDALGVGTLLSTDEFDDPRWRSAAKIDGRFVYHNDVVLPPLYGVARAVSIPDAAERLNYLKSERFRPGAEAVVESGGDIEGAEFLAPPSGLASMRRGLVAHINMPSDGILVTQVVDYPGIKILVDRVWAPTTRVNHAFAGAALSKGPHQVSVSYDASRQHLWEGAAVLLWALTTVFALI